MSFPASSKVCSEAEEDARSLVTSFSINKRNDTAAGAISFRTFLITALSALDTGICLGGVYVIFRERIKNFFYLLAAFAGGNSSNSKIGHCPVKADFFCREHQFVVEGRNICGKQRGGLTSGGKGFLSPR